MPIATTLHFSGRLTADPELRFTPSGNAVANFNVAVNRQERNGDDWVDAGTDYYACTVWRAYAENVVESLRRGDNVIVIGRLKSRNWEDKDGNKRTNWDVDVDEIGVSLRFNTVTGIEKSEAKAEPEKEKVTDIKTARRTRESRR